MYKGTSKFSQHQREKGGEARFKGAKGYGWKKINKRRKAVRKASLRAYARKYMRQIENGEEVTVPEVVINALKKEGLIK